MELEQTIDRLAADRFGLASLRPYQKLVIQRIAEQDTPGSDHKGMLVILPTGSGKSVCFMLPSLLVEGLTVIVYPLLSLMNDQMRRFERGDIPCVCIRGGQTKAQRKEIWQILEEHRAKVVITNAECLGNPPVISRLASFEISLLVVDEAHTVVQWGTSFRPSYREIGTVISYLQVRQVLAFTATASESVSQTLVRLLFAGKRPHVVRGNADRENIVYHCRETLSKSHSVAMLLSDRQALPAVVFCTTRKECELACEEFISHHPSIPCRYYHAGLGKQVRKELEQWFDTQRHGVLFATCAFGMGVDKQDIRTVIHRTLCSDAESYLQESGRAGRDGNIAHAYVLLGQEERVRYERGSDPFCTLYRLFASRNECYRKQLMALLQTEIESCNGCDVCDNRLFAYPDGYRQIVSTVVARPFSYNATQLAHLLATAQKGDSRAGVLDIWTEQELAEAIGNLVARGTLRYARYPKKRLYPSKIAIYETLTRFKGSATGPRFTLSNRSATIAYPSDVGEHPGKPARGFRFRKQPIGKTEGKNCDEDIENNEDRRGTLPLSPPCPALSEK